MGFPSNRFVTLWSRISKENFQEVDYIGISEGRAKIRRKMQIFQVDAKSEKFQIFKAGLGKIDLKLIKEINLTCNRV